MCYNENEACFINEEADGIYLARFVAETFCSRTRMLRPPTPRPGPRRRCLFTGSKPPPYISPAH